MMKKLFMFVAAELGAFCYQRFWSEYDDGNHSKDWSLTEWRGYKGRHSHCDKS